MAVALLAQHTTKLITIPSAGNEPVADVEPDSARVLEGVGTDLGPAHSKPLTEEIVEATDLVVTLVCGDACPVVPGRRYLDWSTTDPAGQGVAAVRPIRDGLKKRIEGLIEEVSSPRQDA